MGSRGQSSRKGRRALGGGTAKVESSEETREERLARQQAFRDSHVEFLGEWVEKPKTLSGWVEMGKIHELLSDKVRDEKYGHSFEHERLKSAEEMKEILGSLDGFDINVSRMKNPEKVLEKVLEATRGHNLEKAKKDRDWAVNVIGSEQNFMGRTVQAMGGKDMVEFLGINKKLYRDRNAAKQWHREWTKILHPDNNPGNPKAEAAMRRLTDLYELMIGP